MELKIGRSPTDSAEQHGADIVGVVTNRALSDAAERFAGDEVTTHGDEATVVSQIQVSATDGTPGSTLTYHSNPVAWTFQTVNDNGWRVCRVDAPSICGTLLRCDSAPDSTTSPSPSVSPSDDLLGGVREMLPCGPRDPFRDMRRPGECPSGLPSPSFH